MVESDLDILFAELVAQPPGRLQDLGDHLVSFLVRSCRGQCQAFPRLGRLVDLDGDGLSWSSTGNRDTAIRSDSQLQGSRQG
jgi:hypothetical protein